MKTQRRKISLLVGTVADSSAPAAASWVATGAGAVFARRVNVILPAQVVLARFARLLARRKHPAGGRRATHGCGGFSLEEVVMSVAITAVSVGGIATGYVSTAQRAAWVANSAAAQSLALQRIEQARAAKWDPQGAPAVDELVSGNFPEIVAALDVPAASSKFTYATNRTTITTISVNPAVRMIQVDCVWSFPLRGLFTNTVITYRSI